MCIHQELDVLDNYVQKWFVDIESNKTGLSPHWWVLNTHLLVHAVDQLRELGPVREYWMFVFESLNGKIKRWVKNNAYPVQSIMNGLGRQNTIRYVKGLLMVHELRGKVPRPLEIPPVSMRGTVVVPNIGKKHVLSDADRRMLTKWMQTNVGHYARLKALMDAHNNSLRARYVLLLPVKPGDYRGSPVVPSRGNRGMLLVPRCLVSRL